MLMKKRLNVFLAVMGIAFFLAGMVSCSGTDDVAQNGVFSVSTGKISGTARFSNVEESANGGIMVTLDKTDGLRTVAVARSENARSAVDSARAVVANTVTAGDGTYAFENLEPGTYTVYAASSYSAERAVCTNVVVRASETTVADSLKLTATGSITGAITIDGNATGNTGFLVFVAGTSYMAMTNDAGRYKISDVPAGEGYQVVATKNGVIHNLSSNVTVVASVPTPMPDHNFTASELEAGIKGDTGEQGIQGEKGEDGKNGTDGVSMVWLGAFASDTEIENPTKLNAYFNTTDGCSYIYTDTGWTLLARSGANGADGKDGVDGKDGTNGQDGKDGANGLDGTPIVWQGERTKAPANPELNWAYYNSETGCSYIWNGESWDYPALADVCGADTLICFGLCNDQIGYILCDNDYRSMLTENEEVNAASQHAGSILSEAFEGLIAKVK